MRRLSLILGLLLISSAAAFAQEPNADLYHCEFKGGAQSIIPKNVMLARSDADGSVKVSDAGIQYFEAAMIDATVKRENEKVLIASWRFDLADIGIQSKVLFRISIRKKSGKAEIFGTVPQYKYRDNGSGKCTMTRGTL